MAIFLILLNCFQFVFAALGLRNSLIYAALNPYVLLLPFALVWLALLAMLRRPSDKNLLLGLAGVVALQAIVFPVYRDAPDFPFVYVRAIQYFWGPAILLPSLLGLFALSSLHRGDRAAQTAQAYIKGLCWIAATITLLEVLAVDGLGMSPLTLPYVDPNSTDVYPFRPWGLPAFPQVNAILLAVLFWLSRLYSVRGVAHKLVTFVALAVTFGATGQLAFLAFLPLLTRRPFLASVIGLSPVVFIVAAATYSGQYDANGPFQKFDFAYIEFLVNRIGDVLQLFLPQFSARDLMFGTGTPTLGTSVGFIADWGYFNVFYAYGMVGLLEYLVCYGMLLYIACPPECGFNRRLYFAIVALGINFHYGALNYYNCQFLLTTLAALQLYRRLALVQRAGPSLSLAPAEFPATTGGT